MWLYDPEGSDSEWQNEEKRLIEDLKEQREAVVGQLRRTARQLALNRIYDQTFFDRVKAFVLLSQSELDYDIKLMENEEKLGRQLHRTTKGRKLLFMQRIYVVAVKHAERLQEQYSHSSFEQMTLHAVSFLNTFFLSCLGLQWAKHGLGKQRLHEKRKFKRDLIQAYDADRFDPRKKDLQETHQEIPDAGGDVHLSREYRIWNCVGGLYRLDDSMSATHIFGYRLSRRTMEMIFGKDCKDEMFSINNGLVVDYVIERAFNEFVLAFVPAIADLTNHAELAMWEMQHPKEYKIQILDHTHWLMSKKAWRLGFHRYRDLHDEKLVFRTDHRPREQYIYWRYLLAVHYRSLVDGENNRSKRRPQYYRKGFKLTKRIRTFSSSIKDTRYSSESPQSLQSCPSQLINQHCWSPLSTQSSGIRDVIKQVFHGTHESTFEVLAEFLRCLKPLIKKRIARTLEKYLAGIKMDDWECTVGYDWENRFDTLRCDVHVSDEESIDAYHSDEESHPDRFDSLSNSEIGDRRDSDSDVVDDGRNARNVDGDSDASVDDYNLD